MSALLLVSVAATACVPTTYVAETGGLGVHVDDGGQIWLVAEFCDRSIQPTSVRFLIEGDDNFESNLLSEYQAPDDDVVPLGPWRAPLFDLEQAGYALDYGSPLSPDDIPFRVRIDGWGLSTVVRELPEPGTTVYFDVRIDEYVTVKEEHPTVFRCP